MKTILFLFLAFVLSTTNAFAQSDIKMRFEYGSKDSDLMSILYFEDIGFATVSFSGSDLKDKDYQISIKEIAGGKIGKTEVVFDSKEDEYFKVKGDKFGFRLLTKVTPAGTARFHFQFNGFSKQKEYKLAADQKEFALKSFLGNKPELSIPLASNTYILTYMMPYVKKDGSKQYCEVAQSGVDPEDLGTKYAIPTYFLIDIKFQ